MNLYEGDPYDPAPERTKAEQILTFVEPRPVRWLQAVLLRLNRLAALPWVSQVEVVLPSADRARLAAIPREAGLVMVAPHPDPIDGSVMLHLIDLAGRVPAGFLMASDALQRKPRLVKRLLRYLGAIPVVRGRSNAEAIGYLAQRIAAGGWGQLFPEGAIYYSRQVMPMEYGAYKIAVDAALRVQASARGRDPDGRSWRPILLAPCAHVYFHTDARQMARNMERALRGVEARPEIFGRPQAGPLVDRLKAAAHRILEVKAERHGVPLDGSDVDIFARGEHLQRILLHQLEAKYEGGVQDGYARRRAMKVRMSIYERLKAAALSEAEKAALKEDIQRTLDVVALVPFNREYLTRFNDLEAWGEFLRRFRDALGLSARHFGRRRAVVRLLPPQDVHPIATRYAAIPTEEGRRAYLFDLTEALRRDLQAAIDTICREHAASPGREIS
jgi:1-acyl-sn-glycerol-3-phosphate acyltransferase